MGEGQFQHLVLVMHGGIELLELTLVFDKVQQSVLGLDRGVVEVESEPSVQVGVESKTTHDVFIKKLVIHKDRGIGSECNEGARSILAVSTLLFALLLSQGKRCLSEFAVPMTANEEVAGECIYGFGSHAVESNAKLKDIVIVFGTGVDAGYTVDNLSQRDAPTEISHSDGAVFYSYVNMLSVAHDELIDCVIHDFLEQDVYAVVILGSISSATDVHSGSQANVLK